MSLEFVVIVVCLYLVECFRTIAPGGFLIGRTTLSKFKLKAPHLYPSNGDWGWVFLNPLRPDGPMYSLRPSSCGLTSKGVILLGDSPSEFRYVAYSNVEEIKQVVPKGVYTEIALLPKSERSRRAEACARERMATGVAKKRAQELEQRTKGLRRASLAWAALCFIFFPLGAAAFGLRATLIPLLIAATACSMSISVAYYRSARVLKPGATRSEIYGSIAKFVLYPISALRSMDHLSHDFLDAHDPAAVAMALCGRREALEVAKRELILCRYGVLPDDQDADALRAMREYREARLERLTSLLKRGGVEPLELGKPPDPIYPHSKSFCPSCGTQYLHSKGECVDCQTIQLLRLPANTNSEPGVAKEISVA